MASIMLLQYNEGRIPSFALVEVPLVVHNSSYSFVSEKPFIFKDFQDNRDPEVTVDFLDEDGFLSYGRVSKKNSMGVEVDVIKVLFEKDKSILGWFVFLSCDLGCHERGQYIINKDIS